MTRLIAGLGSVLATLMCCSAALAVDYPKKVFDATYEMTSPTGPSKMRMTSDGKGHMRTETESKGGKYVTISDYPNLVSMTLLEAQKMALKSKLSADSYQGSEAADMKKKGAKDLGSKVVAGHPCHGYEYSSTAGASKILTQIWIGNDIDWFVQSTAELPNGKSITTLKTYSSKPADSALFSMTPPAGYKVSGP